MSTIRKRRWTRPDGSTAEAWVCDYNDQHGKRRQRTFSTKKAADAWLVNARGEVRDGTHTAESASITVAEMGELWLRRADMDGLEVTTVAQYRQHLRYHIEPLLGGDVRLSKLTTPEIEGFRDKLVATRSRAMTKKVLSSLKTLLSEAQRQGRVAQNVALPVRAPSDKRHKKRMEIPSKDEINILLASTPERWRPFIVTAVFTGMRASELRGLLWKNIDLNRRVIEVRQRADKFNRIGALKSAKATRDIPMGPSVLNALREWRLRSPKSDFVFSNGVGRVESYANIMNRYFYPTQIAAGLIDEAGKPKFGLHALRHFFASWLIDRGFQPKRIQLLMGHSSITVTYDVYGHLLSDHDDHDEFAAAEQAILATSLQQVTTNGLN